MKTWGIGWTLIFAVIAFVLGLFAGVDAMRAAMGADLSHIGYDGAAVAASLLVGNPVQVVTLAFAARATGEDLFAYLGLDVPRPRDVIVAVAALALLIFAGNVLTVALGRDLVPAFQLDLHRSAQAEGALVSLWIALIVAAPVGEEVLFRGFLFRGFVHGPRDVLPGILAISLIWALLHHQYDWFGTTMVFVIGVFLGFVRLYSGSTTLVILLHMLLNLESMVETVIALGWV